VTLVERWDPASGHLSACGQQPGSLCLTAFHCLPTTGLVPDPIKHWMAGHLANLKKISPDPDSRQDHFNIVILPEEAYPYPVTCAAGKMRRYFERKKRTMQFCDADDTDNSITQTQDSDLTSTGREVRSRDRSSARAAHRGADQ
jgi:hypothetical protein